MTGRFREHFREFEPTEEDIAQIRDISEFQKCFVKELAEYLAQKKFPEFDLADFKRLAQNASGRKLLTKKDKEILRVAKAFKKQVVSMNDTTKIAEFARQQGIPFPDEDELRTIEKEAFDFYVINANRSGSIQ